MGAKPTFHWELLPPEHLWYFVGLITSDGCLSGDGRHIDITSAEIDYLKQLKLTVQIPQRITRKIDGFGTSAWHIQIGSKSFYQFLVSIGLMPRKSKRLVSLKIPNDYFAHFLRGVIDGDGCIRKWIHPGNGGIQWSLRIYSGSKKFLQWLEERVICCFAAEGKLHDESIDHSCRFTLKFGKLAAQRILEHCYGNAILKLERKSKLAYECFQSERGWSKSKTLFDQSARVVESVDTRDSGI